MEWDPPRSPAPLAVSSLDSVLVRLVPPQHCWKVSHVPAQYQDVAQEGHHQELPVVAQHLEGVDSLDLAVQVLLGEVLLDEGNVVLSHRVQLGYPQLDESHERVAPYQLVQPLRGREHRAAETAEGRVSHLLRKSCGKKGRAHGGGGRRYEPRVSYLGAEDVEGDGGVRLVLQESLAHQVPRALQERLFGVPVRRGPPWGPLEKI